MGAQVLKIGGKPLVQPQLGPVWGWGIGGVRGWEGGVWEDVGAAVPGSQVLCVQGTHCKHALAGRDVGPLLRPNPPAQVTKLPNHW